MTETTVVVEKTKEEEPFVHKVGRKTCSGIAGLVASQLADKAYTKVLYAYRARKSS